MQENEYQIKKLKPMRIASVSVHSSNPESDALAKLESWSTKNGLLDIFKKNPIFGFDLPNHGYEFWMEVNDSIKSDEIIKIIEFSGGLYVVKRCNLSEEMNSDFFKENGYLESWKFLDDWVKSSKFQRGKHQNLERIVNPSSSIEDLLLDLYFPITESL